MKKLYLLTAILCFNVVAQAQVSTYTFSTAINTYTPLAGGTPLIPPASGISGTGWFEQVYNVPLPFVYYYNGIGYSSVFVNSNGYLTFAKAAAAGNAYPWSTFDGESGIIMGYSTNSTYTYSGAPGTCFLGALMDKANANAITYGTTGTAPNRIFIVQWTNAYRTYANWAFSGAAVENITFQIRLKETSNVAEIMYNTWSTNATIGGLVVLPGLIGASTADFNIVNSVTNWTTVANSSVSRSGLAFSPTVGPVAGETFTFTPPSALQPIACSGTPAAPTVLSDVGITSGTANLSLSGLSRSTGLTYQWQKSATGLANSWTSIAGATGATYAATPTAATYYQCLVSCGASTATSTTIAIGYEAAYPAITSYTYNTQNYASATIGSFSVSGGACGTSLTDATNVIPTYNYTTFNGGPGGPQYNYVDKTASLTHIKLQGSTTSSTSFTASVGNFGGNTPVYDVWIDLNDNGTFTDAGEFLGGVSSATNTTATFTVTIPANNFGIHRMRIRGAWSAVYSTTSLPATGAVSYFGECYDYMVEVVPPTPTASSNSPVCVGGTLTLTSASLASATYTWTGPLSYYSTTASTSQNYVVPSTSASGTYSLNTTVDGSNSCSPSTTSVTVKPDPTLTSATNSGPICAGNTLTLSANGALNVTGYSWSGPVAITSPTSAVATVPGATTSATGTYTVAVSNGAGSNCTATYTTTATVNALPNVSVFSTSATNSCIGLPGTVTISSSSLLAGTYTVTYNLSGANTATGNTASVTMSGGAGTFNTSTLGSTGATTVTITSIRNALGCSSTVSSGNSFTFTVNPLPSPISGALVVCAGLTTSLSDAGSGTWASGNTAVGTIDPSLGVFRGISGGTSTVTYTLPTGCITTAVVTVNQTPAITGVTGACVGNTTTLSDPSSGGIWSSTVPSVATIGSSSGIVTGVSIGTTIISYTLLSTGCVATTTVNITAPPTQFTVTGGGYYCAGGSGLAVGLSSSASGVGYQLYRNGSSVGAPIGGTGGAISFGTQTLAGIYTVVANPGTSCSTNMFGSVSITINAAPTVFNVTGGGAYCAGGSSVHVGLSGSNAGINYQLYNGGSSVGAPVAGTGTILDFGTMTAIGTYTVTATNATTGCSSNMSGSATISTNPLPTAYAVTGGGTYCTGGTGFPIGLANSNSGITYQLYNGGVPVGSAVSGTGSAITFGIKTAAGTYTVVATNTATGCTANMLGSASIIINPLPTVFNVTGGGSYCSGGAGVHVGLSGSTAGVTYTVYRAGTSTGVTGTGTGVAIDLGLFTTAGIYTVVATNTSTGCVNNMLGSATITINPLPAVFTVTGGGSYCAGGAGVHIGLSGSTLGASYFLYNGASIVGGASGTSAPLDFGLQTGAGTYTVVATLPGTGCSGNMTGSATVVINALPTPYSVTGGGSYCAGGSGLSIGLSNSDIGTNYKLLNGGVPVGSIMAGTGSLLNFGTFTTPGVYTVVATNTATGCVNTMAGSAVISINPLPVVNNVTGGGSYCAGGIGVHIGLDGSSVSNTYQLMNGTTPVGSSVSGTGSALDFGLQTAGGVYTVVATNPVTGCINNMAGSATVNINSLPATYNVTGGGAYCFGGTGLAVSLSGSSAGVNYQLYLGTTAVGAPLAGTGASVNFGLKTAAGTYTVVAINATTSCANSMAGSAVITVTTVPTAYNVTGGGNYCSGGTGVHIGLSGSDLGMSYQLYRGTTAIGSSIAGSGLPIDFGLRTTTGTYTVVATNGTTACTATMAGSATIGINPLPMALSVTGGGSYCAGGTGADVGLASSVTGTNYQLYNGPSAMGGVVAGTSLPLDFGMQTIAGTYTVVATNTLTGCSSNMPGSATVLINPLPVAHSVTGGGNYCVGGVGVAVGLDGSNTGISYQLYNGTTAVGSPMTGSGPAINFGLQTAPSIYTVQATSTINGCTNTMAGSAAVSLSATPTIYNVTGGGAFCPSGTGVAVGLSGSDLGTSYQLYRGSAVGVPVVGTGAAINFGLQTVPGTYTVVATGAPLSCLANMNGSAVVTVNALPVAHNVTGGGDYCYGGAGLAVGLDMADAGVSYQLYNGSPAGSSLAGAGAPLSFGLQTASGIYTVVATDQTSGCTNAMTGSVGIVIDPLPVVYLVTGGGSYCAGTSGAAVTLSGSDPGIIYELYNGTTTSGPGVPGTGAALNFGPQPAGVYTVSATNATTHCSSNMGGTSYVVVNPLPSPYTVTGGGAYCVGGTGADVQLNGSATGINYQLYDGILAVGSPIAGSGAAIDFGMETIGGSYTVQATNSTTGCTNTMTGAANVAVNPLPAVYAVTGSSPAYCAGGTGVTISATGSDRGVNYQLYFNGSVSGSALPGSGGSLSFGVQTSAGTYTVIATNTSSGCTATMSGGATVAINPVPTAYNVTGGGSYCAGGTGVHVKLSGTTSGTMYQLYKGTDTVGVPQTGTGGMLDFGLQTATGNYTVIATNPVNGCASNMNGSTTIGINPVPAAYAVLGGGSYCAGGSGISIALISSATGVKYQLQMGTASIGSPVNGTGAALDFGHQTAAGIYTVQATNAITGCTSTMTGSGTIAVNPLPAAYVVTGGGSYCDDGTGVHVGLNNSSTGIKYQLYRGSPVGGAVYGNSAPIDFGLQTISGTYTVVATDTLTGCTNNMPGAATVATNALPAAYAVTGGGNYCAGGSGVHVGLTNSTVGIDYTLSAGTAISTKHGTGGTLDFGLETLAGTYTVTALNTSTRCIATMPDSAIVHISAVVAPSVSLIGNNMGCNGHMSTFTAVPLNGGVTPIYQWTVNGVTVGTDANTMSYLPHDGDVVNVTMTSNAACAIPAAVANSTAMSVNAMEHPAVVLSADHSGEICKGTVVTFTAIPNYGGNTPLYTWLKNGIADTSDVTSTYSYAPADGDNIQCILRSSYACRISDTASSEMLHESTVAPLTPIVVVTASNGGSVAAGVQEVLTANVTNGGNSPSYQWYINGYEVQGATTPVLASRVFSDLDVVKCKVTTTGPCGGAEGSGSITINVWNVGVQQVSGISENMSLVPNPSNGSFNIQGAVANSDRAAIDITDLLGRNIYSANIVVNNGKINEHIELSSLIVNGMYIVNLHAGTINKTYHLVIER